jgi:hypothetical protein
MNLQEDVAVIAIVYGMVLAFLVGVIMGMAILIAVHSIKPKVAHVKDDRVTTVIRLPYETN